MKNQHKSLGFWMLTALVAGNMIGSGVFLLPASLATFGSIGIVAWGFTALGALVLALVFARLSRAMPLVGGPYAYCREAFGDFVGFLVAYNYWIAMWVGNAAIVVAFVGYLSVFFPNLNTDHTLAYGVSMLILWSVTGINIFGLRQAGIVQVITVILKLVPLVLIALIGLFYIKLDNLGVFNLTGDSNFSAITAAAALTLWSFIGLESATIPAENACDPEKNIPRATIFGVIITALVYILSTIAVMGILPNFELSDSAAPYALAASHIFGHWGGDLVAIGAIVSCFGALNGWTLLTGQIPMAAARDNLFPGVFAKQSVNDTPYVGLIVSSLLISIMMLLTLDASLVNQFTLIILLATLATLIPYLLSSIAQIILMKNHPDKFSLRHFTRDVLIASIAFIYSYWTIFGAGSITVYHGCLLLFSGVPLYAWMVWKRRSV